MYMYIVFVYEQDRRDRYLGEIDIYTCVYGICISTGH